MKPNLFFCLVLLLTCHHMTVSHDTTHHHLQKIASVLTDALQDNFTDHEHEMLDAISSWREDLSTKSQKVGYFTISHMARIISIPHDPWAKILMALAHTFQPNRTLEIGTCIGMSCAYFAGGLKTGQLITLEHFEPLVPLAQETFTHLGLNNTQLLCGDVRKLLAQLIEEEAPFDFVFDDHIHEEEPVMYYFNTLVPHLAPSAVYIFDDIMRNPSMESAWKKIKNDPRIRISITLTKGICYHDFDHPVPRMGICIIDSKVQEKLHFDLNLENCKQVVAENGNLYTEGFDNERTKDN